MTDYNDGNWHGWSGGKCPDSIHPQSVIEYAWRSVSEGKSGVSIRPAGIDEKETSPAWSRIIAFRVITPYQAPREFWAVGMHLHWSRAEAEEFCALLERDYPGQGYSNTSRIIKLVKVKE